MKFTTVLVAALTLAPSVLSAPAAEKSAAIVEKRSILSSLLGITGSTLANLQAPISTLLGQVVNDVTNIIVPQTRSALFAITLTLRTSLTGILITVLGPIVSLTGAEVQVALATVQNAGQTVYQVLNAVQTLASGATGDALALINQELASAIAALTPFVTPILNYANHAVGAAGTIPTAATAQITAIVNAINAALAASSGPIATFINSVGFSDALAALQAALV